MTLFMFVFTCLLLLSVEFFLRIYYHDVLSTAGGRSYFSLKNFHLFKDETNGFQLRGKQFLQFADNRYRVVVLGDSLTWGQGVHPQEKRFTEKVEQLFNKDSSEKQIEIVNTGICGHDLPQHYNYLSFIHAIQPDFVLYQWFANDMDIRPDFSGFVTPHLLKNKKAHDFFWQHSAFYFLLQRSYGKYRKMSGEQKSYTKYLIDRLGDPEGKAAKNAKRLLLKFIDNIEQKGPGFGIVLFPSFAGPMDDYQLDFLHEQVLAVCEERQLNCLDLRETYKNVPNVKLWANVFDPHPGELAHEMAAEAIYKHFGPSWQAAMQSMKPRKIPEAESTK